MADNALTYEDAYNTLVDKIYFPTFFTKLANDYSIRPNTQDDAKNLLVIAEMLRHAQHAELNKVASDGSSLLHQATNALAGVLKTAGVLHDNTTVSDQEALSVAGQVITNDHSIKDAAVVYQDYLAQVLAANQTKQ